MAAPCDPAPENAIIVVCSVYFGEESQERVFPGAPCWYADPPPLETRKRCRNETMGEDRTFVTTVYGSSRRRFAGICISQPHRTACPSDTTGFVSIGVAISGAVTIARKKPLEEEPDLDVPNPGDNAFFTPGGKIHFDTFDAADESPIDPSTSLGPVLIRFLRSVLPPVKNADGSPAWTFGNTSVYILNSIFCVQTTGLSKNDFDNILRTFPAARADPGDLSGQKAMIAELCAEYDAGNFDTTYGSFDDFDVFIQDVVSYVCKQGLSAQGYVYDLDQIKTTLKKMYGKQLELQNLPSTTVSPWARVLDTGDANTVRILLKLV